MFYIRKCIYLYMLFYGMYVLYWLNFSMCWQFDHVSIFSICGRTSLWRVRSDRDCGCTRPSPPSSRTNRWRRTSSQVNLCHSTQQLSLKLNSCQLFIQLSVKLINSCLCDSVNQTQQLSIKLVSCLTNLAIAVNQTLQLSFKFEKLAKFYDGNDIFFMMNPTSG